MKYIKIPIVFFISFSSVSHAEITSPIDVNNSKEVIDNESININNGSTAISIKGKNAELNLVDSKVNASGVNQNNSYGIDVHQGKLNITGGEYNYLYDNNVNTFPLYGHALNVSEGGSLYVDGAKLNISGSADSSENKFLIQSWGGGDVSIKNSELSSNTGRVLFASNTPVTITDSSVYVTNDIANGNINAFESQQNARLILSGSKVISDVNNSANSAVFYAPGDGFIDIYSSHLQSNYGQTVLRAVDTGNISVSDTIIDYTTSNNNTNSSIAVALSGRYDWKTSMELKNTTLNAKSEDGRFAIAVYLNHTDWDDPGVNDTANTIFTGNNFTINTEGNIEAFRIRGGGGIELNNSHVYSNSDSNSAFNILSPNDLDIIDHDAIVKLKKTFVSAGEWVIYQSNTDAKFSVNDNSYVKGDSGLAIVSVKDDAATAKDTNLTMQIAGDSQAYGDIRVLDYQGKNASLNMFVDNAYWEGDIITKTENSLADIELLNDSVWKGSAKYYQDNKGGIVNLKLNGESARWVMTSSSTISNLELKNGEVYLGSADSVAGNRLFIDGNYAGASEKDKATIIFNTVLGADNSLSDKMIVNGNTSGHTMVSVRNLGGQGDATLNGIELISVTGLSDGVFEKKGRIVAGAYDYDLIKKDSNWYLTSYVPEPNPEPNPTHKVRPEAASYTGNLAAANSMFNTRLHDRLGETQYTDALTGEEKVTGMWMRQLGGHNNWRDNSGQLKTQSNRYVMQLGGDIAQWSSDGFNRWRLGVMAGYGHENSHTNSSVTDYKSRGSVNGYSIGTYATWYANGTGENGLYLDSWLQFNWFNNEVNGESQETESYRSRGLTASAETGYTQKLTEFTGSKGSRNEWFIQPQAQITFMNVRAGEHREKNGTHVENEGDGNIQTRLGMRTYLKGHTREDDAKNREFQPFIEANWVHNTRNFSTKMDGVNISQKGTKNLGEVKIGVEGQINPHLNLWGNVGVQVGDNGYNDSAAMLGIRYNF